MFPTSSISTRSRSRPPSGGGAGGKGPSRLLLPQINCIMQIAKMSEVNCGINCTPSPIKLSKRITKTNMIGCLALQTPQTPQTPKTLQTPEPKAASRCRLLRHRRHQSQNDYYESTSTMGFESAGEIRLMMQTEQHLAPEGLPPPDRPTAPGP